MEMKTKTDRNTAFRFFVCPCWPLRAVRGIGGADHAEHCQFGEEEQREFRGCIACRAHLFATTVPELGEFYSAHAKCKTVATNSEQAKAWFRDLLSPKAAVRPPLKDDAAVSSNRHNQQLRRQAKEARRQKRAEKERAKALLTHNVDLDDTDTETGVAVASIVGPPPMAAIEAASAPPVPAPAPPAPIEDELAFDQVWATKRHEEEVREVEAPLFPGHGLRDVNIVQLRDQVQGGRATIARLLHASEESEKALESSRQAQTELSQRLQDSLEVESLQAETIRLHEGRMLRLEAELQELRQQKDAEVRLEEERTKAAIEEKVESEARLEAELQRMEVQWAEERDQWAEERQLAKRSRRASRTVLHIPFTSAGMAGLPKLAPDETSCFMAPHMCAHVGLKHEGSIGVFSWRNPQRQAAPEPRLEATKPMIIDWASDEDSDLEFLLEEPPAKRQRT